tara:strand:- start:50 stop:724 length:675 start_codon:yes stop_codon:yes gene_type:complete
LKKQREADFLYLIFTASFIAALVTTNLIANKFVTVDLGFKSFQISAGVLPYPITFLITDILSEIFGKKRTQRVVMAGFFSSVFVLLILWLGNQFPAIDASPVSDDTYSNVFSNSWRVILSSMLAYLVAQFVDVRIYHFWKKLTNGKHLWLRNNGSTIISQLMDTSLVVFVLFVGTMSMEKMGQLIIDGWMFKAFFALCDTPLMYLSVYILQKWLGLRHNEEIPD